MAGPWKLRGYTVERLIGRGGSGEVWQARIAASREPVALKRLFVHDEEQLRRAHAEAALLSVLDHPHLVRLHALVPDDGIAVLVLDLAEGGSLADLLAARGRLTPGEVITAISPIGAALAYLHAEGVTHGDVSAANVLFTAGGVPLLADLGVARLTGAERDAESTPAYVDPSVAAGGLPGPPSDVFMLAAVAFHALTGAPLWPGGSGSEVLAAARAARLDDVGERLAAAGVPKDTAEALVTALTRDPVRRGTATDFALDLRHSGEPVAVELTAGRVRAVLPWQGARHAAGESGESGSATEARPGTSSGALSGVLPSAPPPTRAVKARPRPVIPRPPRSHWPARLVSPAAVGLVLAVVIVTAMIWRPSHPDASGQPGAAPAAHASAAAEPAAAAVLRNLDARRAQAFARRDVALLRQVYVPGVLLQADTALLERIVPAGCGLTGAHTTFRRIRADPSKGTVVVTAHATLARSVLRCRGRPDRHAPGAGPTTLRVTLTRASSGWRISEQQAIERVSG